MKVYIVEEIYYDTQSIHGVYDSMEKAQAYIDSNPKSVIHNKAPSFDEVYEWDVE